jgi:hypothetical protein
MSACRLQRHLRFGAISQIPRVRGGAALRDFLLSTSFFYLPLRLADLDPVHLDQNWQHIFRGN